MHQLYIRKVRELEKMLNGEGDDTLAARDIIRSMITKVTVAPGTGTEGYDAVLYGDLAVILAACSDASEYPPRDRQLPGTAVPGSQLSVVAGARYHLCRTIVRVTPSN